MTFHTLSTYFSKLEATTLRNEMTKILSELYKEADKDEIGKLCYLLQGRVVPLYEKIEFGVADKMVIRAIAQALNIKPETVLKTFKEEGDLGKAVEKLKVKSQKLKVSTKNLRISEVYEVLYKVATSTGNGSQEIKAQLLSQLIRDVDPLSARYIVRMPLGKMRLGFSDQTVLDAFSWMIAGDKSLKDEIERAYNVRPDLGFIASQIKKRGMEGIKHITPTVGTPILMARANRLSSSSEILEKIGECAVEYKYDGLRLQVHYSRKQKRHAELVSASSKNKKKTLKQVQGDWQMTIKMFSRNLEDITEMFPDIKEAIIKQITAEEVILEGEVVAYNPHTGVFVPFQETMQRKRKYDIAEKALEIPVKLFAFELLYANGKSFLGKMYTERKKKLKSIIQKGNTIVYAQEIIGKTSQDIEDMFDDSVAKHFEGIMAKKLDGLYEAGVRGWNWIKFKKAMSKKLSDTIDVLVMGYTMGEGKRTTFGVGQFLTGVYDEDQDKFVTTSKIGTGLTDEQFREFIKRVKKLEVKEKPKEYDVDKLLPPDVWLRPSLVVEVGSDEITRSAVHTAGRGLKPSKSGKAFDVATPGFALRFPRLENFRDDKKATDATSVKEIAEMFKKQFQKK